MHEVECFGPVLGVMRARDIDHAIALVNEVDYGLTSGIHTLDDAEIRTWIDGVQAGNLYVNRGTTGAIVQRQPFGGWKRSVVGPTVKAGGPHYVSTLTGWARAERRGDDTTEEPIRPEIQTLVATAGAQWVQGATVADARAWRQQFGIGHDPTGLHCEANVLRYVPEPAVVRWDGTDLADLVRVSAAMMCAGGRGYVSSPVALPDDVAQGLTAAGISFVTESSADALDQMRHRRLSRVRYVGAVERVWRGHADIAVFDGPVTAAPELELVPFVKEQAVSLTTHRYGTAHAPSLRIAQELRGSRTDTSTS